MFNPQIPPQNMELNFYSNKLSVLKTREFYQNQYHYWLLLKKTNTSIKRDFSFPQLFDWHFNVS